MNLAAVELPAAEWLAAAVSLAAEKRLIILQQLGILQLRLLQWLCISIPVALAAEFLAV